MPFSDANSGKRLMFPPVEQADGEGILAIGGDLSPERLLTAYSGGIFPWFSQYDPIVWWAPDPRFVLFPQDLKTSKSMGQILRKGVFRITYDTAFAEVIKNCSRIYRPGQGGTWITRGMAKAYTELHRLGFAHSVEAWNGNELAGGLYGVSLGGMFFGESMFSLQPNASKAAFITLVGSLNALGFDLIDSQVHTPHLESLGASHIERQHFMDILAESLKKPTMRGSWEAMG